MTVTFSHNQVMPENLKRIRQALSAMSEGEPNTPPWTYDVNGELVVAVPGHGYVVRMEYDTNTQQERYAVAVSAMGHTHDELRFNPHKTIPFRTPEEVITFFKLTLPG